MIEERCKECGGIVQAISLMSYPPVHQRKCSKCGRIVSSEREKLEIREV